MGRIEGDRTQCVCVGGAGGRGLGGGKEAEPTRGINGKQSMKRERVNLRCLSTTPTKAFLLVSAGRRRC